MLAQAFLALASTASPAAGETPPNLIFIMADDLGYGDLGCYGQQLIQTPNLDRMAAEGMRFTSFYAGSTVCAPSRCSLMTGRHTGHAAIRGNGNQPLPTEEVTVAEVLQSRDYRCALVGKWGLGEEGSVGIPTRQGFDEFFGYLNQSHAHNYYPAFLWQGETKLPLTNIVTPKGRGMGGVASERHQYSHDLFTQEALAFISRCRDQPFFLYLPYTIPHANNEAGKAGMEVPDFGPYQEQPWPDPQKGHAAMISRLDRDVGRLLQHLKNLDLDRRTVVFFTSDNGPHQEGGARAEFFDSNGQLRGLKRDLTEGGLRVPLIVRAPGRVAPGTTSDLPCAAWDMLPTLAELAGTAPPDGLDGISIAATLLDQAGQQEHDSLYWAFYERGGAQAVRAGPWKAICKPADAPLQLFQLERDPGETEDVAASHPDIVLRMKEWMTQSYQPSAAWRFPHQRER